MSKTTTRDEVSDHFREVFRQFGATMSKATKPKPAKRTTADRVRAYLRLRARAKKAYSAADALLDQLVLELGQDWHVELGSGKTARLKDNYPPGTNKVFRAHGISRFELSVEPKGE